MRVMSASNQGTGRVWVLCTISELDDSIQFTGCDCRHVLENMTEAFKGFALVGFFVSHTGKIDLLPLS